MIDGTQPPGVQSEEQAARWVRAMFDRIAPRYDFLNHFLSFNIDRTWRKRTARRLRPILQRHDSRILDLCCGSGDLMLALSAHGVGAIMGTDFSHAMLVEARRKALTRSASCPLFEADALRLPLGGASLDLVTAGFGFRNFVNYRRGLEELLRVLKPGGTAAILEFTTPSNAAFRATYNFYSRRILPWIGGAISGSREAYLYLPESVRRFPAAAQLASEMREAGFCHVEYELMTFGTVALHLGRK